MSMRIGSTDGKQNETVAFYTPATKVVSTLVQRFTALSKQALGFASTGKRVTASIIHPQDCGVSHHIPNGGDEIDLWPELEELLKIPQIRALKDEDLAKIMALIKREDEDALRDVVHAMVPLEVRQNINAVLAKTPYEDLDTLLGEVIKQKPKKKESLDVFWNMPPDYFINKTLYLSDPVSFQSYIGTIVGCRRQQENWIFNLDTGTEVCVSPLYRVEIVQKYKYRFWNVVYSILAPQQTFIVESASDRQLASRITPGLYQLGKMSDTKAIRNLIFSFLGSFNGMRCREIELLDGQTKEKRYLLNAYYKGTFEQVFEIDLLQWNQEKQIYRKQATYTLANLNAMYNVIKLVKGTIASITPENVVKHLRVRDEIDENKIKLVHLKQIKEQRDQIQADLLKPENRELLDALIDDLVHSQLNSVHPELLARNPDLMGRLQAIVQKYTQDLQQIRLGGDILKEIVIAANYALLVDKEKNVLVSRTMELLHEAEEQNDLMAKRDAIFFMGNTGSGKSTAVGYFLGLPLEIFTNRVGERVVKIKESHQPGVKLPKIGQSLGESETLYTQGYVLSDSLTLGDCPGFNDTRGSDYELCSNLSIDRAVQKTDKIRALVLTVPVHSFLVDRGNPIIDLVETVRERFPRTFDPDNLKDNSRVFVLLTKSMQARSDMVQALIDGRRIDELFDESAEKIQKFLQNRQAGARIDDFELESIQKRNRIWSCLQSMYRNQQIQFIDVKNKKDRTRLLKQYSNEAGSIDKSQYVPAMQSRDMQMKFGKQIEMATKIWTRRIFEQYMKVIPAAIQASQDKIKEKADLVKKHRNFAIILKLQDRTLKLLREFAEMVIGGHKGDEIETVAACREFIDMYDQNISRIREECEKDLAAAR